MPQARHSAPGSNAGYTYQYQRALLWLAQSPAGALVGIETDDDVAIKNADGTGALEQNKNSLDLDASPFGNRSKDLWNTLHIWLEAIESGVVNVAKTKFFMVTNKILKAGIVQAIGAASTPDAAAACVKSLEVAAIDPPIGIVAAVAHVLRPESRELLLALIQQAELVDGGSDSSGQELRLKTIGYLQIPAASMSQADSVLDELLGWLQTTTMDAWHTGKAAWIPREHFVNCLHAALDRRSRQLKRERSENLIPVESDSIGKEQGRTFVRQLHLVTDDDAAVDGAICEFIRCNIEKIRLSVEGNVSDDDWLEFEQKLLSRWKKIQLRELRMRSSEPEHDVGYVILTETTEQHREKLAGQETEQIYLTAGTYHLLADTLRVGWHPRYDRLMKEEPTDD